MRNFRSWLAALIALVFATTMGAASAQNVKSFDLLNVSLTGSTVSAEFKNLDNGNSTFNAASLKATATGGTVTFSNVGVKADGVTVSASNVFLQDSNTKLVVTSLSPVKKSKSVVITATVNVAIGAGQCAPSIEWQGSAWTGSVSSPSQVFSQANANPSTGIDAGCKLAFSSLPPSLVRSGTSVDAFNVGVTAKDSANNTITGFGGTVTLAFSGGCSLSPSPQQAASSGVASFSGLTPSVPATETTCSVQASTTTAGIASTSVATLKVFDGKLACTDAVTDALSLPDSGNGTFDASAVGDALGETGFLFGVRGYDPNKGACPSDVKLNYTVVNNIPGDSGDPDPQGNTVPVGFYSLTWDESQKDGSGNLLNPVIAVVATFGAEWGAAATGLPTKSTLLCTNIPCTTAPYIGTAVNTAGGWKVARACLSTKVLHSSLPFTDSTETTREKGCVASERWDVVPTTDCTGSPPTGSVPAAGRCLKATSIMMMGNDPVFGR